MPRKRGRGRPRSPVKLEPLHVRISRTVLRAVREHAAKRDEKLAPTVSRLLLLGMASEPGPMREALDEDAMQRAKDETCPPT